MAANNAFEADGPTSVASAISVFPPLRSRPPAQWAADGLPPAGPRSAAQPAAAEDLRCANVVCSSDAAEPLGAGWPKMTS
jgi:hypothetical protein